MKKIVFILMVAALQYSMADSIFDSLNARGYGTFKLRAQTISMYRDFEGKGNGYSTSLGWQADYLTPTWNGLSAGISYTHADVLHAAGGKYGKNGEGLLSNGNMSILNELWLKYNLKAIGLANTYIKVGRQTLKTEIFYSDESRHKHRTFEAAVLVSREIPNTVLTLGHIERTSNTYDDQDSWEYKDIENVLGANYKTDGITWAEFTNKSIKNTEIAMFNAYAHDIANVAGGRIRYKLSDTLAFNMCYRHETDVGRGAELRNDTIRASIQKKIGGITLAPGFISVSGDDLLFYQKTTGIRYGTSLLIYNEQFKGGADTYFIKATTKIDKTALCLRYSYTTHEASDYEGQELFFTCKHPVNDNLSVCVKMGAGHRNRLDGKDDTTALDSRLFVTYNF